MTIIYKHNFSQYNKMSSIKEQFDSMKKQCPFCKIISKELESNIIWQDEICTAFLEINPATKGHMTIVPNEHYSLFSATPPKVLNHMFKISHKLIEIIKKSMGKTSYNIFIPIGQISGQMVQHAALQIMPVDNEEYIKEFDVDSKTFDQDKWKESHEKFKQIYPMMIANIGKKKEPIPEDQIIKIVKENLQLIEMYNTDPEGFKLQATILNAQLRNLFEGQDIDKIMIKANE
ncbi:HIT domain-containing protein [Candidatus Woesearchaeota archaeon]|nr:HIT domain-containing protein [Candidatus Woesearchaeota archaeon]MBT6505509.1 HIT domain-containing protein [Candidatus Woesearchaeota archaeon]MBT7848947.1 HIT domain-containing protein [Candidatus Woesearchaeota archaeon]